MSTRLTRLTCLFSALLLGACATPSPHSVPPALAKAPLAESGIVFGSIGAGADHAVLNSAGLRYRRVGDKDAVSVHYAKRVMSDGSQREDKDGVEHGSMFAQRLPAGEYEVFETTFIWKNGQFGNSNFSSSPFSVRFTVAPGHAVYLGELRAQRVVEKNAFGHEVTAGAFFAVRDRQTRDMELVRKQGLAIDPARVGDIRQALLDLDPSYFCPAKD